MSLAGREVLTTSIRVLMCLLMSVWTATAMRPIAWKAADLSLSRLRQLSK